MCDAGSAGQGAQSVQFTEQSDKGLCKNSWAGGGSKQAFHMRGGGGEITGDPHPVPWW